MMEEQRLPRRERERLRQRQEILDTALSLFSEKGYHNVSMQEIATKAEFAMGTLYRFFRSKEELYRELLLDQARKFHAALSEAIEKGRDEIEKLRNYLEAKIRVFTENVQVIKLYLTVTQEARFHLTAGLDPEVQELYKQFMENLASVFKRGMEKGLFQDVADPMLLALGLENIVNAALLLWLESPEERSSLRDPDSILKILLHGIVKR